MHDDSFSRVRLAMTKGSPTRDLAEYVAVSAGMMFGASCYLVLGTIAGANSVRDIVLAIVIAAGLCIAVALSVGEMASRFPTAPGIRTYLKRAFSDEFSLFFTYIALLVITLFAGIELKVFCDALLPGASTHERAFGAVVLTGGLGYLNVTGRELPRVVQVMICAALVLGTVLLSCAALARPGSFPPPITQGAAQSSLAAATGIAFFVFIGFEWVTPIAKSPEASWRLIPASMLIAIATLATTYLLFALALKLSLPATDLQQSRTPHVLLGGRLFPPYGQLFVRGLSVLALVTILNAGVIGASRLVYILGRDRAFFPWLNRHLSQLNDRGVARSSVVLLCLLCLAAALLEIYLDAAQHGAQLCAGLYCLVYAAFVASHIRLRGKPLAAGGFRSILPLWVHYPLAAVLVLLGVATFVGSPEQLTARGMLLAVIVGGAALAAARVARTRRAPLPARAEV
jgi:amino acid transporter